MKLRAVIIITLGSFFLMMYIYMMLPQGHASAAITANATLTPSAPIFLPIIHRHELGVIYNSRNLADHLVVGECNPGGGTNCSCSNEDVHLVSSEDYGVVTSNIRMVNTYVNAIGYKKFVESFPSGEPIALGIYTYTGEVSLPVSPFPDVNQHENPDAVHMMVQLWDGRNALFKSNKTTLEGTIFWDLNPWNTQEYGKIKIYTKPIQLIDTGILVTPTISTWHNFALVIDLTRKKYISVTFDGITHDISNYDLAQVKHPDWSNEVFLSLTTESLASWPQQSCTNIFSWATWFKNLEFRKVP